MAQRRMFSPQIVDSDAFLDMSSSAQALYFHLGMKADDDGFVGNPRKILRMIGGNEDDLKILFAKRFILAFESGVIVIKHWRINNLIRKDWYKETVYLDEKGKLEVKENGAYTEKSVNENATVRSRRLGKVRLGKDIEREITPSEEARQFFEGITSQELLDEFAEKTSVDPAILKVEFVKFASYWKEKNKSGTKERWEMEATFEVRRRLAKWLSNVQQFGRLSKTNYVP